MKWYNRIDGDFRLIHRSSLNHAETALSLVSTLDFLGAGIDGLGLIFPTSFPSIPAQDVLIAGLFVALMVGVILLGALAGSDDEDG